MEPWSNGPSGLAMRLATVLVERAAFRPERHASLRALADSLRWAAGLLAGVANEASLRALAALGEIASARAACADALSDDEARGVEQILETIRDRFPLHPSHRGPVHHGPSLVDPRFEAARPADDEATTHSTEPLSVGATVPRTVHPGEPFVARFVGCRSGDEAAVLRLLGELEQDDDPRERRLGTNILRSVHGMRVHVEPGPGLDLIAPTTATRALHWTGVPVVEDFVVLPAPQLGALRLLLTFRVEAAGVTLTQMTMTLQVGDGPSGRSVAQARMPTSAFASYASRDRSRVLDRVGAIRIATGLDIFIDCLDLAPGRAWQRRLEQELLARDLFMLFWSLPASRSDWVKWEYERALELRGRTGLQIQPLENGVEPPAALADLHFADPLNDLREATLSRAATPQVTRPADMEDADIHIRIRRRTLDDDRFQLGVIRLGRDRRVTYINRALSQLLDGELAVGTDASTLDFDAGSRAAFEEGVAERFNAQRGSGYPLRVRLPRRGTSVLAHVAAVPEYSKDGELLGSIGFVTDHTLEVVSLEMHRAMDDAQSSGDLLARIGALLAEAIRFDSIIVNALSADGRHLRRLFDYPSAPASAAPFRWWPMPPFVQAMVRDFEPGPLDLDRLFESPEFVAMGKTDEALQQFKTRGFQHSLRLRVKSRGQQVAIVTLMRRRGDQPFVDAEMQICRKLPLLEAVNWALTLDEQDHRRFSLDLVNELLGMAEDMAGAQQRLVDGLWSRFRWEHISLFQQIPHRGKLIVVCQAREAPIQLPADFEQSENDPTGLIARAWREGKVVNQPRVADLRQHQPAGAGVRSELVVPLPGRRMRWLLNVESTQQAAFAVEELSTVQALGRALALLIDRAEAVDLAEALMEHMADVVIRTNHENTIVDVNRAAVVLFQQAREALVGRTLDLLVSDPQDDLYGDDADDAETLTTRISTGPDPSLDVLHARDRCSGILKLRRADGSFVRMLVSVSPLPVRPDQDDKLFVASDLTSQEYRARVHALVPQFRQLASEIRVPLALAASFLDEADEGAEPHAVIEAALAQLSKADISVERVMRVAAATEMEPLPNSEFVLRNVLSSVEEQWPRDARRWLRVMVRQEDLRAVGSFNHLSQCVESVLARLMTLRKDAEVIDIKLGTTPQRTGMAPTSRPFISIRLWDSADAVPRRIEDIELERDVQPIVASLMQRMGGEFQAYPARGLYRLVLTSTA